MIWHELVCDSCGATFGGTKDVSDTRTVRFRARSEGWKRRRLYRNPDLWDLCPACATLPPRDRRPKSRRNPVKRRQDLPS